MSRIGRAPIQIPTGVEVKLDGAQIAVKGPKGNLEQSMHPEMQIMLEDGVITVARPSEQKKHKALHGLTRTLIQNMVTGVSQGFQKELEIQGVGYRCAKQGSNLVMNLGYSHQVIVPEIEGISIDVPSQTRITIIGIDKQKVGQFAAEVREKRPPEPYKGKGVRYLGEHVKRKEGKTGKGK